MCGSVDLVVIVVETSYVGARELGNLSGRSTNTAAYVKDLHSLLDPDAMGKVVFVTGDGLTEGLAMGEAAEVERLAPSVLVQISGKIVIAAPYEVRQMISSMECREEKKMCATYCLVKVAYSAVRAYQNLKSVT